MPSRSVHSCASTSRLKNYSLDAVRKFFRQSAQVQDMGSRLFGMDTERAVQLVDVLTAIRCGAHESSLRRYAT